MNDAWVIEYWDRRIVGIVNGIGTIVETWRPYMHQPRRYSQQVWCTPNQRHTLVQAMEKARKIKLGGNPPLRIRCLDTGNVILADIL